MCLAKSIMHTLLYIQTPVKDFNSRASVSGKRPQIGWMSTCLLLQCMLPFVNPTACDSLTLFIFLNYSILSIYWMILFQLLKNKLGELFVNTSTWDENSVEIKLLSVVKIRNTIQTGVCSETQFRSERSTLWELFVFEEARIISKYRQWHHSPHTFIYTVKSG